MNFNFPLYKLNYFNDVDHEVSGAVLFICTKHRGQTTCLLSIDVLELLRQRSHL